MKKMYVKCNSAILIVSITWIQTAVTQLRERITCIHTSQSIIKSFFLLSYCLIEPLWSNSHTHKRDHTINNENFHMLPLRESNQCLTLVLTAFCYLTSYFKHCRGDNLTNLMFITVESYSSSTRRSGGTSKVVKSLDLTQQTGICIKNLQIPIKWLNVSCYSPLFFIETLFDQTSN